MEIVASFRDLETLLKDQPLHVKVLELDHIARLTRKDEESE
jgi:hypothetical protein